MPEVTAHPCAMTTTFAQSRVARGVPTGGQFAATARPEASISLMDPSDMRDDFGSGGVDFDENPDYDVSSLVVLGGPLPERPVDVADQVKVKRAARMLRDQASTLFTRPLEKRLATAKIVTAAYAGVADPSHMAYVTIEYRYREDGSRERYLVPLDANFQPLDASGESIDLAGLQHDQSRSDYVNDTPASHLAENLGVNPVSITGAALLPVEAVTELGRMAARRVARRENPPAQIPFEGEAIDLADEFAQQRTAHGLTRTVVDVRKVVAHDWRDDIDRTQSYAAPYTERAADLEALLA